MITIPKGYKKADVYVHDDELCYCGHLKSKHGSTCGGHAEGHGACRLCKCAKFTWAAFVRELKK